MKARDNFYPPSRPAPLDQADGLRRIFAPRHGRLLTLASNPHLPFGGLAVDRVVSALTAQGHHVLVVDAAASAPPPHELAQVDLAACIEQIAPQAFYLCAQGLPMSYVDTRGSAAGFLHAVQEAALYAAPKVDVTLVHADAPELTRMLKSHPAAQAMRPMLLGSDSSESIKHAYAAAKLLATRCGLLSFDLLLVSAPHASRLSSITTSLGDCVERFLDGTLCMTAVLDPAGDLLGADQSELARLLHAQMRGRPDVAATSGSPSFGATAFADAWAPEWSGEPVRHRQQIRTSPFSDSRSALR